MDAIPAEGIELLELPLPLARGEYLDLLRNGIRNADSLWTAPSDLLVRSLGKERAAQLELHRPKPKKQDQ